MDERALQVQSRCIPRFRLIGVSSAIASLGLVVAALAIPTSTDPSADSRSLDRTVPDISELSMDRWLDLSTVAGSRLIRPAQVQPAVKDSGAAQKLLARLKLQSVVDMSGEHVAYIRVKDEGVQAIRGGSYVLDFLVESVQPGRVRLSLDGVIVELAY